MRWSKGTRAFAAGGAGIVVLYSLLTAVLWSVRGVDDAGPLSLHARAATAPLPHAVSLGKALDGCFSDRDEDTYRYKVVAGVVHGEPYYGCYELYRDDGSVSYAAVVDADGFIVTDVSVLKASGAWRWLGTVKTFTEVLLGGLVCVVVLGFAWLYYRRVRPGAPTRAGPFWASAPVVGFLGAVPFLGWGVLWLLPRVSAARKARATMQGTMLWTGGLFALLLLDDYFDVLSFVVLAIVLISVLYGVVAGRRLVAPPGFGLPEDLLPDPSASSSPVRSAAMSSVRPAEGASGADAGVHVVLPEDLPTFADIGGADALKDELRDIVNASLAFPEQAATYGIEWNGVLLHGPPGVGKTFFARATAGEFGLRLIQVSVGDLVSAYRGDSARNVEEVFEVALRNVPCLLFFDEFDAVAEDRSDTSDGEAKRTVAQLLESLEQHRRVHEVIVMAATNHLDQLDPAVIRPGRFDRHVRVDLPDEAARRSILETCLRDRPLQADLDLADLADRTGGLTPAAIAQTVQIAAMAAFKEATETGRRVELTQDRLVDALQHRGGTDRPTVEDWTWDALVLPEATKDELQQLQLVIEDSEGARALGVDPPTGVLLAGPPGTGKTTVAKVLAAQAKCSFYPVSAADITSKWLGESEQKVQDLFQRARDNRPSVIFIDEVDGIAGRRGSWDTYDRQLTELLQQMDGISGQAGVLVVAATNRPRRPRSSAAPRRTPLTHDHAAAAGHRRSRHAPSPVHQGHAARRRRPRRRGRPHRWLVGCRPAGARTASRAARPHVRTAQGDEGQVRAPSGPRCRDHRPGRRPRRPIQGGLTCPASSASACSWRWPPPSPRPPSTSSKPSWTGARPRRWSAWSTPTRSPGSSSRWRRRARSSPSPSPS
jgi:SpoVK/Ycf46/Vps4 family AAA+-type ATPase